MTGYVVGADVGTSALKAVLVHPERGVVAVAEHAYPMERPQPGWAQNDPGDWYRALAPPVRPEPAATAHYAALRIQWERVRGQVFPALGAN